MSSFDTAGETQTGFLSSRDVRVIGGASALMGVTVALMYAIAVTPLAAVNEFLFGVPIIGVLVYGAAIMVGELIAERGVKRNDLGIAFLGMVVLQLAFGIFGAGVLTRAPRGLQLEILGVTAAVTIVLTALISGYVYARRIDFDHWGRFANYAFIGGIGAVLVGTFVQPVLLVGFLLIFLGFMLRLGWEIWRVREKRNMAVALQTIGVYIAVAGVFVHVLQLVLRALASQD